MMNIKKFMTPQIGQQLQYTLSNISRSKDKQTVKVGYLIKYSLKYFPLKLMDKVKYGD